MNDNKNGRKKLLIFSWSITIFGIIFFGIAIYKVINTLGFVLGIKSILATISAAILLTVYSINIRKLKLPKSKAAIFIEKAITDGTVVKANLIKAYCYHGDYSSKDSYTRADHYRGKYEYIVNGRTYKYKTPAFPMLTEYPKNEIELYYDSNNPRKAIMDPQEKLGISYIVSRFIFMFLIPCILLIVLIKIFGINIPNM